MCGIIGYKGNNNAKNLIFNALKNMEYRGYDSAGIGLANGTNIIIEKEVGNIEDLVTKFKEKQELKTGIGHTRWATHGKVSIENAHPHYNKDKTIAIVHNGIIENYRELKKELEDNGYVFNSETDSEVLVHLIDRETKEDKKNGFRNALEKVKGTYALITLFNDSEIYAAKNESPLLVGISNNGIFLASDSSGFIEHTNKAIILEDGQGVELNNNFEIFDLKTGKNLEKKEQILEINKENIQLNGYSHYMIKEINEAPESFSQALRQPLLKETINEMFQHKQLFGIACGTSRHAGLIGKHLWNKILGKNIEVMIASECQPFVDKLSKDDAVLGISQSGETADILHAIKDFEGTIYSFVNTIGSTLHRKSKRSLTLNCGKEIGVGATKSFISQLGLFYLIAYEKLGKRKDLEIVPHLLRQIKNDNEEEIKELAKDLAKEKSVYFIGRSVNFPVALEGSLKLKELSYIHAEGMPAGELKHGTLALIEKGTKVIVINPDDETYAETKSNAIEAKARGAILIGITDKENGEYDKVIKIPKIEDKNLYPILCAIPMQLLAYYTALEKGNNPDKPRNLAKSVTVR